MKKTRSNIFRDIYYQPYNASSRLSLYTSSKASLQLIQRMSLLKRLKVHNGCVNSICWNSTGELILSGSDDQHLVLTNAYNYEVLTDYRTSHRANIFSAKFLPNSGDHRIVSCSGDGIILYTDLMRKSETFYNRFTCHSGTTYEIATIPGEPHSFLSCGEDGTVRWFDLRVKDSCNAPRCREDVLISCQKAVTALSVNPVLPHQIAIGCSDSTVRTFDRRTLGTPATGWTDTGGAVKPLSSFTVPELEGNSYRITSLSYSPDGQDVLVSYSSDHIYLFSMKDQCNVHFRKEVNVSKGKGKKHPLRSPQPVRRLRLRGDWSDTGPDARPGRGRGRRGGPEIAQARPVLQSLLMQRMADVVTRILNGPETRAVLSGGGESSFEDIMEQQANNQSSENNAEASEERSAESAEEAAAQPGDQGGEPIDVDGQHDTSDDAAGVDETQDAEGSSDQAQEQEFSQPTVQPNNESEAESETNVPMETESSQTEAQKSPTEESTLSCTTSERNEVQEEERIDEGPCTSMGTTRERDMMENLQDRLTTMRDGFLEKHGSEPAVSLTYSDKGSTSATISLGVADEIIRDGYHAGPSGSRGNVSSGSDHDKRLRCTEEKTDDGAFSDSDDEDVTPSARLINSVESEMDEAIANARSHQGHENFDETCLTELCVKQKYMGHRNARTMIKEANFWGNDFVMSGSDCGHVFVWERETAKLCMLLEADQHVVNCLQPHPYLPMLATSGIDYDVKLWAPINYESNFAEEFAEDLKKRNAVMLEETKDTITVPTDFMIRMLTCICQIRRERQNRRRAGDEI